MRRLSTLAVLFVIVLAAGCATLGSRDDFARRSFYLDTHPGLSPTMRKAVEDGCLVAGMSRDMVMASVGLPSRREALPSAGDRRELWEYGDGAYDVVTSLTFEGDQLVSIEQTQPVTLAVAQARLGASSEQPVARGGMTRIGLK
jgi:hypothetical protein